MCVCVLAPLQFVFFCRISTDFTLFFICACHLTLTLSRLQQLPIRTAPVHRRLVRACVAAMCASFNAKSFNLSLLDAHTPRNDAKWARPLMAYGVRHALNHALEACSSADTDPGHSQALSSSSHADSADPNHENGHAAAAGAIADEELDRFHVIRLSFSLQYWELRSALDFFGGFGIRPELSRMVPLLLTDRFDRSIAIAPFNMPSCNASTTLTQVRSVVPHILRFYEETVGMWAGGTDVLTAAKNIWFCALHRPGWTAENRQAIECAKRWQKRGQYLAISNLPQQLQRSLRCTAGHASIVCAVAVSPDGTRTASASMDRAIKVWNNTNSACERTLLGHVDDVVSLAYHPTGAILASGSRDKSIRIWSTADGACLQILQSHTDAVRSLVFTATGDGGGGGDGDGELVSASGDQVRCCAGWKLDASAACF